MNVWEAGEQLCPGTYVNVSRNMQDWYRYTSGKQSTV